MTLEQGAVVTPLGGQLLGENGLGNRFGAVTESAGVPRRGVVRDPWVSNFEVKTALGIVLRASHRWMPERVRKGKQAGARKQGLWDEEHRG